MGQRSRLPLPIAILALVAALTLLAPMLALVFRADWGNFGTDLTTASALSALRLSFVTAIVSTILCLLLGVPLALYLAANNTWAAAVVRTAVNLPLVMPPLVGGLSLLMLLGRRGILGGPLYDLTGWSLPFTTPAVIVAQTFVAMPFMVITVEGVLRAGNPDYAHLAATLGANRQTVLRRVVLPLARPGLVAGTILTFARALGEFGATALFAGNREGITQTMPLAIYTAFNGGGLSSSVAITLALVLMAAAFAVMMLTRSWYPKVRS